MTTYFTAPVRIWLLAIVLALAAQTAVAGPATEPRSASSSAAPAPDGTSIDGMLIVIGIVGVVIFLAWVCSRFGDSR